MQAVIFTEQGEKLMDVPDPSPTAGEVLIRVEYCGICGSDLHAGRPDFHYGTVMGHEFSGVVIESSSGFAVGERVVVNPNAGWCGRCPACFEGAYNACPEIWPNAVGLARPGGLAPYAAVQSRMLRRIPDSLSLSTAAWVEPTAVALRAVRTSGIKVGDDALVLGGGPIGLLVAAVLRASGAGRIAVVEPHPTRRRLALDQGADMAVEPEMLPELAPFQFAFECSGAQASVAVGVKALRHRGVLTVNGFSRQPPAFDAADLLFKEIQIRGSFIYLGEFAGAIDLLAAGRVQPTGLVSGIVPVAGALTAFNQMRTSPDAVKYQISDFHH